MSKKNLMIPSTISRNQLVWIRIHAMQFIEAISTWNYAVKHHIKHIVQKAFYTNSILNICTFHNLSFALLRTTSDDLFYFIFLMFSYDFQ
jgi:superfamily I DNA/RNA helicase